MSKESPPLWTSSPSQLRGDFYQIESGEIDFLGVYFNT